jgi:hypothetical protein
MFEFFNKVLESNAVPSESFKAVATVIILLMYQLAFVIVMKIKKKTVFCYQNCSDLLGEKNWSSDFEIPGQRPRICKTFEINKTIYSNSERSEQFLVTEYLFNIFS